MDFSLGLQSTIRAKLSKPLVLTDDVLLFSLFVFITSFVSFVFVSSEQITRKGPPIHVAKNAFIQFFNKCSTLLILKNGGRQFSIPVPDRNTKKILRTSNKMNSIRRIVPRCFFLLFSSRLLKTLKNILKQYIPSNPEKLVIISH